MIHHLMIGTWTRPGAIFTVAFDDEDLTLKLVKRTEIPHDEPISWMTFDVSAASMTSLRSLVAASRWADPLPACEEEYLWRFHEDLLQLQGHEPHRNHSECLI
jgi:hypothetical protein